MKLAELLALLPEAMTEAEHIGMVLIVLDKATPPQTYGNLTVEEMTGLFTLMAGDEPEITQILRKH